MEVILSLVFQVLSSSFIFVCLVLSWKYIRSRIDDNKKILIDLVFFFSCSKISLYYILPSVLRTFSFMSIDINDGVEPIRVAQVYLIELFSWFFWLIPFFLYVLFKKSKKVSDDSDLRINYSKNMLLILLLGFVVTRLMILVNGEVSAWLIPFQSLFSYAGKAAGPLLFVLSLKYFPRKYLIIGFIGVIVGIATYGTRGALVYSIILLLFIFFFIVDNKKYNKMFLLFSAFIVVSYFSLGGLAGISYTISDDGKSSFTAGLNERKIDNKNPLEKIEDRFGAPTRIGTAFIDLYDRGESADGMPILNSALAFLPRAINPNKPFPNALKGDDLYTQGMYIIFREIYGYNTFQMVEFPTGGHFYWQFGILGVIFLSVISGLYILASVVFYSRFGLLGIAFLFGTFKPWGYVDPKIWVSDIVLQLYQVVLPTLVFVCMAYLFLRFKRLFYGK